MKKRLLAALIPVAACLAVATPALAATSSEGVSENWAGYEATTQSGDGFSAASGSWTVPTVVCDSGEATYAAFWVGLGGGDENSDALEQEGTEADCSADGNASYYAWYELVPSAPVKLSLKVSPGDVIYARTAVHGDQVTVQVTNRATDRTFRKTLEMTSTTPDVSTAEWVAEAPSECNSSSLQDCQPLTLSDFGTVKFTDAKAKSGGYIGKVGHWAVTPIALESDSSDLYGGGYGGGYSGGYPSTGYSGGGYGDSGYGDYSYGDSGYGDSDSSYGGYTEFGAQSWEDSYADLRETSTESAGDAAPSSLNGDGTGFSVTYGQAPAAGASSSSLGTSGSTSGSSTGTSGDSGYGVGDGYGDGDGYGGYGDGYSTYGDGGYGDQSSSDGWGSWGGGW
jgi:hypothetical protein